MKGSYSKKGIVALCAIVYFVSYFSRKDFAAVMAEMLSEGVLDKGVAGLIGTMLFAFYGIGQLVSGYLGDKIKPKYLITFGLGLTAACNFMMPLMKNPAFMIPVWGANGFAQAMLWPPIVKILADNLNYDEYVTASLVVVSAAHVSTISLYLFVPLCIFIANWQTVFIVASALSALSLVAFMISLNIVLPKDSEVVRVEKKKVSQSIPKQSVGKLLVNSGVIPIFGCIATVGFLRDGIESWLPTLYSEAFGRDSSESILVSVILPIFAMVTVIIITALHKKPLFNNEVRGAAILFIASIALCIPLAILITFKSALIRVVCLVLAALICAAMHAANSLLISCLPGRFARFGRVSTVSGLTNAFIYVGAAASMYGIAVVAENLGWRATAISWIIVAALGVALALAAYRRYTKFVESK